MLYRSCISVDICVNFIEFHNKYTNDFIKQHHIIYKLFKSGIAILYAKKKYKERINICMIKNKICYDIENVILSFLI